MKIGVDESNKSYRLPTESEWQYAAQGGNVSKGYIFSGSNKLKNVCGIPKGRGYAELSYPIGIYEPNELGIYDMTGNVYEWCYDWYGRYSSDIQKDPKGPETGKQKVVRGGDWTEFSINLRTSNRNKFRPDFDGSRTEAYGSKTYWIYIGFRIAKSN